MGANKIGEILRKALVVVTVVVTVLLLYSRLTGAEPPKFSALSLAASLAVFMGGWLVSAVRLKQLVHSCNNGLKCSFRTFIEARFLGELLARITPSSIGGEPARAYHISRNTKLGYLEAYMLTLYEVYFDVVMTCVVGAIASIPYLPLSAPVLLVSLTVGATWVIAFNFIDKLNFYKLVGIRNCAEKLMRSKHLERVVKYIRESKRQYSEIRSKITAGRLAMTWLLTALIHILWATSIIPLIAERQQGLLDPFTAIKTSLSAYFLMQAISIIPTPGGSGVAEYGLTIVLAPEVVVVYRAVYYFIPLIIGLVVSLKYLRSEA